MYPGTSLISIKKALKNSKPKRRRTEKESQFDPGTYGYVIHQQLPIFSLENDPRPKKHLVGILFAPPKDPIADTQIIPFLSRYHYSSGENVHFFCAGYFPINKVQKGPVVCNIDGTDWGFSEESFALFQEEISELTSWHYKGGAELLLFDSESSGSSEFSLYTGCALNLDLNIMIKEEITYSVSRLFHQIFAFTKSNKENSPCRNLQDKFGLQHGIESSIKNFSKEIQAEYHFKVIDVSR